MITVIHPEDETTAALKGLYEGMEYQLVNQHMTNREVRHVLNHAHAFEWMMILGHGSKNGLLSSMDHTKNFDRVLVGKSHLFYLRKQHRLIGIWCHADEFAEEHHLSGLFTGMFISELEEAQEHGVSTTKEEVERELFKFVQRLRGLLDEGVDLAEIPQQLKDMDDVHSPLTEFNYHSVYYFC